MLIDLFETEDWKLPVSRMSSAVTHVGIKQTVKKRACLTSNATRGETTKYVRRSHEIYSSFTEWVPSNPFVIFIR